MPDLWGIFLLPVSCWILLERLGKVALLQIFFSVTTFYTGLSIFLFLSISDNCFKEELQLLFDLFSPSLHRHISSIEVLPNNKRFSFYDIHLMNTNHQQQSSWLLFGLTFGWTINKPITLEMEALLAPSDGIICISICISISISISIVTIVSRKVCLTKHYCWVFAVSELML